MSQFWLTAWSVTLGVGWLLPNHYLPWSAFHLDFWVACAVALAGLAVIVRAPSAFPWYRSVFLAGALALLPWLQSIWIRISR